MAPVRALAAGDDVATAQVLFDDARKLMAQNRYADACPKLVASQHLAPAIGTEFNLADCWEHAGKLASAWAAFLDVVDQTHKRGEAQREAVARERAAKIEPKLGRLTIQAPARAPGEQILRDGEPVPAEVWGVAVPIDAGDHRIEARAPGREAWSGTVHTSDAQASTIGVPDLPVVASPPPERPEARNPIAPPPPTVPVPGPTVLTATDYTPALIAAVSALAFAGVGVLGILEHDSNVSTYNADNSCGTAHAPSYCNDYVNTAGTWEKVAIVGFVGAGIAIVGGVTLWIIAPRHPAKTVAEGIGCGPVGLGLTCRASF
jgi:hypothetical protein